MFQAISLASIAVLTVIDQLTKYAAVATVKVNGPKAFLFGLMQFRYVENTGAAFSMFSENTSVLAVFSAVLIIAALVLLLLRKVKSNFINTCIVLMIAGGIGNAIDRVRLGYVVDFIEPLFIDFAVFNFADCCITVGAFMLIGYQIYDIIRDNKKKKASEND
ncbi:MAG: signal peptidase II [Clostridia bacterium]|nr:signal peptidase II [Clostridia bacterium]